MINKNGKIIVPSQFAAKQRALNAAKQQKSPMRKVPKHLQENNTVESPQDIPKTSQDALQGPCDSKGDTTPFPMQNLPFRPHIQKLSLRDRIILSSRWIFDSLRSMLTSFPKYALFHLPNPDHPNTIKAPVMRQILSQRQYSELNTQQPPKEQSNTHSQNK